MTNTRNIGSTSSTDHSKISSNHSKNIPAFIVLFGVFFVPTPYFILVGSSFGYWYVFYTGRWLLYCIDAMTLCCLGNHRSPVPLIGGSPSIMVEWKQYQQQCLFLIPHSPHTSQVCEVNCDIIPNNCLIFMQEGYRAFHVFSRKLTKKYF